MDPNRVIKVIWPMVLNHAMEKLYKIYVCPHWSLLHVSATKCISQHMLLHCGSPLRLPLAASTVAVPLRLPLKNCMLPHCGSPLRLPHSCFHKKKLPLNAAILSLSLRLSLCISRMNVESTAKKTCANPKFKTYATDQTVARIIVLSIPTFVLQMAHRSACRIHEAPWPSPAWFLKATQLPS